MSDEQHEIDERHDSLIVEGDDRDHVLPPQELDPFTPEPDAPTVKARWALWVALALIVVVLVVVIFAAVK